jgi:tRNA(fMet)-specific endonuclease VapC
MKYLLDTNVISELVAKQPNPNVTTWVDTLAPETVYLSVITIGEIRKGIEKLSASKRKEVLTAWLEQDLLMRFANRIALITTDVMLRWGALVGQLELQGRSVSAMDSLIAAIALEGDFTLATRNEADFQGTGVRTIDPWTHP